MPPSSRHFRLVTNKSDCDCCRPNVWKCLCILISLWLFTMIFLAIHTDRFHHIGGHANHLNNKGDKNNHDIPVAVINSSPSPSSETNQQQRPSSGSSSLLSSQKEKLNCFAVVVSNEEYIDGTLILGYSLRKHSKLAQTGKAELVVIVPEKALSKDTMDRLLLAGWDHVLEVEDLAKKAPKAHWAGTFNKLHLFSLTQYSLVAFFDADMLMQHNPDYIFRTHLKDYQHIGALGNSLHDRSGNTRAPYFQTGMMLLIPHQKAFDAMMEDFYHGKDSRGLNGRDGLIIRRYFGSNYKNLDDALSAHVATQLDYDWVTGLHFRGSFKPWFNRRKAPAFDEAEVHRKKKEGKNDFGRPGKWLEIGPAYSAWWATYEEFHRTKMVKRDQEIADKSDFPEGYDPKIHVWMNRHSKKKSYIQLLRSEEMKERERKIETELGKQAVRVVVSEPGASCDAACSKEGSHFVCHDSILGSRKYLQSCAIISKHLETVCNSRCLGRERRGNEQELEKGDAYYIDSIPRGGGMEASPSQPDSISCAYNSFLDPYVVPRCNATASINGKRICACVISTVESEENNSTYQKKDEKEAGNNKNEDSNRENNKAKESENDLQGGDAESQQDDHSRKFNSKSCEVIHPAKIKKTCMMTLADAKNTGHWSILDDDNQHNKRKKGRRNNNNNKKHTNKLIPILSRHHDGFAGTIWFPQKSSPFTVEKILLSHLVGRILGFEWVPPTTLQLLPMKTTPKNLIKHLKLHKNSKNKEEGDSSKSSNENANEQLLSPSYEERFLSDTIEYLTPTNCPDVVLLMAKNDEENTNSDDSKNLYIKSVVSFHRQHQHKISSSASLIDWESSTGFAEASLLKFILGVNHYNADNSHDLTWEELMEHVDELSAKNMHEFAHEVPRCVTLEGIEKEKRQELFSVAVGNNKETKEGNYKNRIQLLDEVVKLLHSTFSDDEKNAESSNKKMFTDLLNQAEIDSKSWNFIANNDKKKAHLSLDLFDLLSSSNSANNIHPKKDFGNVLDRFQKRIEALQPLTARCKLL